MKIYTCWILSKFLAQEREDPRDFLTHESHYVFGTRYLLKLVPAKRNRVELKGKKLYLYTTDQDDKELNRKTLYSFYRRELRETIEEYILQYLKRMSLDVPEFKIRTMKTKWGSCATDSKRLLFNIELAKKPLDCIEYIVVHEMVHQPPHNCSFSFFPKMMIHHLPNSAIPVMAFSF